MTKEVNLHHYDAIVVGARAAGSPTAMLLARKGYRVLLVDRARFPSDTISTHMLTSVATRKLIEWGVIHRIAAASTPISNVRFDMGPVAFEGFHAPEGWPSAIFAPRRTLLDKVLVDAAVEAGVELRQGFSVKELIVEDGRVCGIRGRDENGKHVEARATIVIGADGKHSFVAKAVGATEYNVTPSQTYSYYSYFSGFPVKGIELYIRPPRVIVAFPTSSGQACVIVSGPVSEFEAFRKDVEGTFMDSLDATPDVKARVVHARREERFLGSADVRNFWRVPHGPGWVLVGDAGFANDPAFGQGIGNAFVDADNVVEAIHRAFHGDEPMDNVMRAFHRQRDTQLMPMFELVVSASSGEPPPPHVMAAIQAMQGNQEQIDRYIGVIAGTVPVQEFYSPENLAAIVAESESRRGALVAA